MSSHRSKKPEPFAKHILPHGELEQVIPNRLWRVTGTLSYPLPREMDIYRFPDGESLLLYSVVALNDEGMSAVEALGKPVILYVPNKCHRLDIGVYADRYPDARVICPEVCREAVEKVVKVDGTIEEECAKEGCPLKVISTKGIGSGMVVLGASVGEEGKMALFLGDILFNIVKPPENQGLTGKFMAWLFGSIGPLRVTRLGKLFLVKRRGEFTAWLDELADTYQIEALMVCHGDPVTGQCKERLKQVTQSI